MNHGILVAFGAVILLASCEHDTAAPTALNRTTPPMAHDLTTVDPSAIPPQGPYEAINLGTLGGANGSARGINNNGAIIGIAQAPDRTTHPFLWQNHVMQALDSGGNGFTSAEAINDDGIIAGTGIVGGTTYAMTWINGTVLALGPVSPSTSVLLNQMGDVAWTGPTPSGPHAFLWHAGTMQDLGTLGGPSSQANGLNDAGQVMGFSSTGTRVDVFIWKNGQMQDVLPRIAGTFSFSTVGFNNRGWIAGRAVFGSDFPQTLVSWLWNGDSVAMIPALPGYKNGNPLALTERGDVYGIETDENANDPHPFVYDHGTAAPLNPAVTNVEARAFNGRGTATGYVFFGPLGNQRHAVVVDANDNWDLGVLGGLDHRQSEAFAIDNAGDVVGESSWFGRIVPVLWRRVTK